MRLRPSLFAAVVVLSALVGCGDKSSSKSSKKDDDSSESDSRKKKSPSAGASASAAASAKVSAAPAGPLDGFVRFTSPEGRFELMLPQLPPPAIKTPVEVRGQQVTMYTFAVEQGNAGFAVSYGDVTGQLVDLNVFLKDSVTGAFKGMAAKLDGTKEVKSGDSQGLEGTGTHPQLGTIRVRIFASVTPTSVRQYNVMSAGQPDERATAFFESFKITK